MKVAFLGPEGTYTHMAAEKYFEDYEPVKCSTIREAVETGLPAVIPFENSLGGSVGESLDLLRQEEVTVTGEVEVAIDHVLASKSSEDGIEKVRSHPQALSQSREFLEEKGWEEVEAASTARAAQEIEEGESAICSRLAAELNDLEILEEGVQDRDSNTTRFLVLNHEPRKEEKTSMVVEPGEDRPGLLAAMLSCFSGHGINLSYIQSRPTKNGLGEYFFYVEAEAGREDEGMEKALTCLETYSEVDVLGSY